MFKKIIASTIYRAIRPAIISGLLASFLMGGVVLPALAENSTETTGISPSPSSSPKNTAPKFDAAAMQAAIEKRDTAVMSAVTAYAAATNAALSARKDALKTGWSLTEKKPRRDALKKAWKDYRAALEKARKDFKTAKKSAWDQFYKDRKAAGPGAASEDSTTHGVDNNL